MTNFLLCTIIFSSYTELKVGIGASIVPEGQSIPCEVKEHAGMYVNWLPLLGPTDEVRNQVPYVRVVPLNNGEVDKDVLHTVQEELRSGSLSYVVMVNNKQTTVHVKHFETSAAVVKLEDAQTLLQCVGKLTPVAQDQPESVPHRICK